LQDPSDKRYILCDEKLYSIFKSKRVSSFGMNGVSLRAFANLHISNRFSHRNFTEKKQVLSKHLFKVEGGVGEIPLSEEEVKSSSSDDGDDSIVEFSDQPSEGDIQRGNPVSSGIKLEEQYF
jgi:chromatin remodeling complex protein RSC6